VRIETKLLFFLKQRLHNTQVQMAHSGSYYKDFNEKGISSQFKSDLLEALYVQIVSNSLKVPMKVLIKLFKETGMKKAEINKHLYWMKNEDQTVAVEINGSPLWNLTPLGYNAIAWPQRRHYGAQKNINDVQQQTTTVSEEHRICQDLAMIDLTNGENDDTNDNNNNHQTTTTLTKPERHQHRRDLAWNDIVYFVHEYLTYHAPKTTEDIASISTLDCEDQYILKILEEAEAEKLILGIRYGDAEVIWVMTGEGQKHYEKQKKC